MSVVRRWVVVERAHRVTRYLASDFRPSDNRFTHDIAKAKRFTEVDAVAAGNALRAQFADCASWCEYSEKEVQ